MNHVTKRAADISSEGAHHIARKFESGNQLAALVVRDCRVPSVHYGTRAGGGTGRNLDHLDGRDGRNGGEVAHRGDALAQDLLRAVAAASAAGANTEGFGELIERGNAEMRSAMNLVISDLVADADVHNTLLGGNFGATSSNFGCGAPACPRDVRQLIRYRK